MCVYISYRIDISACLTPDQPREADNLNVKDRFLGTKLLEPIASPLEKKQKNLAGQSGVFLTDLVTSSNFRDL